MGTEVPHQNPQEGPVSDSPNLLKVPMELIKFSSLNGCDKQLAIVFPLPKQTKRL